MLRTKSCPACEQPFETEGGVCLDCLPLKLGVQYGTGLLMMQKARQFMRDAFELAPEDKKIHRDGQPARMHAYRVAIRFMDDPELYAIAILHDVIEDCPVEFRDIYHAFGCRVAVGVQAMTRREGESWNHYVRKVKDNPDAIKVKIADIEDNIRRCVPTDKMHAKLPMYHTALNELKQLVTR